MGEVTLSAVRKSFGGVEVIHGVDLEIADRQFVVFVGPSGCGKTTLLRMIAGLEDITEGEIRIDGVRVNEVAPHKRGVAMVFQSYALYPHMSVFDNMAFGLRMANTRKAEIQSQVTNAAKILQIEPLLSRRPRELSGGQRQRVAIGRAIVRQPKVFLFDEPLSNLDASLRVQMRLELAKLHHDIGGTMIYVTHDQVEAMTLADRIVVLRRGHVEQVGTPREQYTGPVNSFVAGFLGSPQMNFIEATTDVATNCSVTVRLPGGLALRLAKRPGGTRQGDRVTLGIRPEDLPLERSAGDAKYSAKVFHVEYLGGVKFVHVEAGEQPVAPIRLTVLAKGESEVAVDEIVTVHICASSCHLFDADGEAFENAPAPTSAM